MSFLTKQNTGVWIIDVQDNLFPHIHLANEILERISFFLEAARLLKLPMIVTEQYPQGLGKTVVQIRDRLPDRQVIYPKTTFSGFLDPTVKAAFEKIGIHNWILMGLETHICVLQTAKDLINAKKNQVVVLSDAVGSRSSAFSNIALEELREAGARVSTTEAILYEIIRDANSPEFKALLSLVKAHA